tara:strand:+ start:71 stop:1609 length:1539 start_codon:yes stop_codon:yes gene_type:complete
MKVNSICIVGGGSSGWLMAMALDKNLPNTKVTLVESPHVPTIGVGESTIPSVTRFIENTLGLDQKEFMRSCDATYKGGIRFKDFLQKGEDVWHPFTTGEEQSRNGMNWLAKKAMLPDLSIEDYWRSNYVSYTMCIKNKFDRQEDKDSSYGHHIDAAKFVEFCQSKFKGTHVLATVNEVQSVEDTITAIVTDMGTIQADMFIDCTGFKALLIGEALKEPFISYSDTLLNDTALTCRIPYENKRDELQSFTDCTALSAGWVWNTPLWSRIGTGYVYSSKFQTKESAESEFREYLTLKFGKDRANNAEFNTVKYRTGIRKRAWVGNCLALPLAAGFVEPLESTGLASIADGIDKFLDILKLGEDSTLLRSMYNKRAEASFKEIHDFVLMHYLNSKRNDSKYWRHIKNNIEIPESVLEYLMTGKPLNSTAVREKGGAWFGGRQLEAVLVGMGTPSMFSVDTIADNNQRYLRNYTGELREQALAGLSFIDREIQLNKMAVSDMLNHEDYLLREVYTN